MPSCLGRPRHIECISGDLAEGIHCRVELLNAMKYGFHDFHWRGATSLIKRVDLLYC
jgi:hypothetical protein